MKRVLVVFICLFFTGFAQVQAAPDVDVTFGHRLVMHVPLDLSLQEGGIKATLSVSESVSVVGDVPGLVQVNPALYEYIFVWNWAEPLTVSFFNADQETTTVVVAPEPPAPIDARQHAVPVINVVTDSTHLWDPETGLFVYGNYRNYWQHGIEWERPAHLEWYTNSTTPSFNEAIGLRINGGWSRHVDQKPLRFYFDDYGSTDNLVYNVFGDMPMLFQRLIIRTGRWPGKLLNAVFAEGLFRDLGHLASRNRDVAVYLNNEYWGLYTLRERLDDKFFEDTHDLTDDGLVLFKDGGTYEGDASDWRAFVDAFADTQPYASHTWYEEATHMLDMDSYIDWLLVNIYGATADNGANPNQVQYKINNGPYHYITWDEDELFNMNNIDNDHFRFMSVADATEYNMYKPPVLFTDLEEQRIRWAGIFRGLMQNSVFKEKFRSRYLDLRANELSTESLRARLQGIATVQGTEMVRHIQRWGWDSGYYDNVVGQMESWFNTRGPIMDYQFQNFMELYRVPVELNAFSVQENEAKSWSVTWQTASEEDVSGYVLYRGSDPGNLTPVASWTTNPDLEATGDIWTSADYAYTDETAGGTLPLYYQLAWIDEAQQSHMLDWVVELVEDTTPPLFINELQAKNDTGLQDETGTCEDWLEIYNSGPTTVDLTGMFLSDDPTDTLKWELPSVQLASADFLLIWCDDDEVDGPLHANFKLSASGESVALYSSVAAGNQLIDTLVFGPQAGDTSTGRFPDGGPSGYRFFGPTPESPNTNPVSVPELPANRLILKDCCPNPFNPTTEIRFQIPEAGPVWVDVFDVHGTRIKELHSGARLQAGDHTLTWHGLDSSGQRVASGVYIVQVKTDTSRRMTKATLLK